MCDIAIMLGLAFFTASGVCLTAAACFTAESVLPVVSVLLGFVSLMVICSCDLLHFGDDGGMPASLMSGEDGLTTRSDVGWWLCGIFITGAWIFPLIMAHHSIIDMRGAWLSSAGTWSIVSALGLFIVWLGKDQQQRGDSWAY